MQISLTNAQHSVRHAGRWLLHVDRPQCPYDPPNQNGCCRRISRPKQGVLPGSTPLIFPAIFRPALVFFPTRVVVRFLSDAMEERYKSCNLQRREPIRQ